MRIVNQFDLVDTYRILHTVTVEYMFFLSAQGIFIKTDYILGHKTNFIFIRIKISLNLFSNYNETKLVMNNTKTSGKIFPKESAIQSISQKGNYMEYLKIFLLK